MLFACRSWFPMFSASRRTRAPAVLQVEPLEDRLAPAGLAALPEHRSAAPPALLIAANVFHSENLGQNPRSLDTSQRDLPFLILLSNRHPFSRLKAVRDDPHVHLELSALAAYLLGQRMALVPSSLEAGNLGLEFASPAQGQNASTTMMLPFPSASPSATFSRPVPWLTPAGSPPPMSPPAPLPSDFPRFSAEKPPSAKDANEEGALRFELSPFTPSGLGIVPVPVPRGLEERFADLFGGAGLPPAGTTESLLAANGDRGEDAVRAAVEYILHDQHTISIPNAFLPSPHTAEVNRETVEQVPPSASLPDSSLAAEIPVERADAAEDEEMPTPELSRTLLALAAASLSLTAVRFCNFRRSGSTDKA